MEHLVSISTGKAIAQLRAAIDSEHLEDPGWILALEDVDEPPLFSRVEQVDALLQIPEGERGATLLSIGLEYLSSIANLLESTRDHSRRYFACVTVADFEEVSAGHQPVATISLQVDPHDHSREAPNRFSPPRSTAAMAVQEWVERLGREAESSFVVGELSPQPPGYIHRVYVGLRKSPCDELRSVGDYMGEF